MTNKSLLFLQLRYNFEIGEGEKDREGKEVKQNFEIFCLQIYEIEVRY
jgi:hypothetical protein